ncbi:MAG: HAMP domain-containing sensor histidine kinase [Chloroherpetonaceae bacterium]|nr:HAMP domain-containing sensor histidine kinase [Chloroherpetonaceae bacterium]
MKSVILSLRFKLTALFIGLLAFVGMAMLYILSKTSGMYLDEATQRANENLAASISKEFKIDTRTNNFYRDTVERIFSTAMIINPTIRMYLVHDDGEVFGLKNDSLLLKKVSIEKIQNFIARKESFPIYGDNPKRPEMPIIFSASPIYQPDGTLHCYLYIALENDRDASAVIAMQQSMIMRSIGISLLLILLFTSVLGIWWISRLTRDLRQFSQFVKRIEEKNIAERIPEMPTEELKDLSTAFNEMMQRVEISIRKQKESDMLRRELIANVSHDLRTPLASIEGYAETIIKKSNDLKEQERTEYLTVILRNAKKLNRLIHQLFEHSKLEAGQKTPSFEPFSLSELVHDIALSFKPQAEIQSIHLEISIPESSPMILGDVEMIERVLQNLIENALRFTPEGGKVGVQVAQQNSNALEVAVIDNGEGIQEKDLDNLFDRFYQSENIRTGEKSGSGLGLAISRKILELHHSTIKVQSTFGEGTRFSFLLNSIPKEA